jgi:hypothetical protein
VEEVSIQKSEIVGGISNGTVIVESNGNPPSQYSAKHKVFAELGSLSSHIPDLPSADRAFDQLGYVSNTTSAVSDQADSDQDTVAVQSHHDPIPSTLSETSLANSQSTVDEVLTPNLQISYGSFDTLDVELDPELYGLRRSGRSRRSVIQYDLDEDDDDDGRAGGRNITRKRRIIDDSEEGEDFELDSDDVPSRKSTRSRRRNKRYDQDMDDFIVSDNNDDDESEEDGLEKDDSDLDYGASSKRPSGLKRNTQRSSSKRKGEGERRICHCSTGFLTIFINFIILYLWLIF